MNHSFENLVIVKRSGQRVTFNKAKIALAIKKAFEDVYDINYEKEASKIYGGVLDYIFENYKNRKTINVEDIQDIIEIVLKKQNLEVYESFRQYRQKRAISRELFEEKEEHKFAKLIEEVGFTVENSKSDIAEKSLISFGKTVSREYAKSHLIDKKTARAHGESKIYINDLDYYSFGIMEASHLNFQGEYDSLGELTEALISTVTKISKEQYSTISIPDIDLIYEKVLNREFREIYLSILISFLEVQGVREYININRLSREIEKKENVEDVDLSEFIKSDNIKRIFDLAKIETRKIIDEKSVKYLNKLFDLDFEVSINHESTLYEFFLEAYNKSEKKTKLIVKNVPNNKKVPKGVYVNNIKDNLEVFSNGTVIDEDITTSKHFSKGRIVLSTVSLDLARLGYKYNKTNFKAKLEESLELVRNALKERFEYQAGKYRENFLYLFEDDLIYDSKKLEAEQRIRKVIKHGVLNISLSGLLECVCALNNKKQGDIDESDIKYSIDILKTIHKIVEEFKVSDKLNFTITEEDNINIINTFKSTNMVLFNNKDILNSEYKITDILNIDIETKVKTFLEYQKYMGCVMEVKSKDTSYLEKLEFYKVI